MVVGAVITGAPIGPAPQLSQPQAGAPQGASPQGAHSLRRPKQPPKPPPPRPQQPNDTLVKAARVVKISSRFMACTLQFKTKSKTRRKLGVAQLYNTAGDVQTQRVGFFFATGMFFGNALRGIRGMFFLSDQAARSRRFARKLQLKSNLPSLRFMPSALFRPVRTDAVLRILAACFALWVSCATAGTEARAGSAACTETACPDTGTGCTHETKVCVPRTSDEVWLVSSRSLGCPDCEVDTPQLEVWRFDCKTQSWDGFFTSGLSWRRAI